MVEELRNPNLRVVARILETLWTHPRPMRPTQLQLASGTNYTQCSRYLGFLEQRGLLRIDREPNSEAWVDLTPRGFEAHRFLVLGLQQLLESGGPTHPR